jgi:hypothetical protein
MLMQRHISDCGASWPAEWSVALKEWAVVCAALAEGRQIMLLRKGGIYEAGGEFELEHRRFLLFPTYLHQNRAMLKAAEQNKIEPAVAEPATVQLSAAAEVTDIIQATNRAAVDRLDSEHLWSRRLIDMRFDYKPERPLYVLLLRVYRLAEAAEIENTPAYAGCKSWAPLERPIRAGAGLAALSEARYEQKRQWILSSLGRSAQRIKK